MSHIVLIGPIGVGKSTVAPLVGELLGRPTIELDAIRGDFYATVGYDERMAAGLVEDGGVVALIQYWKPFELELVEHVVMSQPDTVLDFGAGHSHFEDDAQLQRVSAALAAHYVVLLLPSSDIAESERVLTARAPHEYRDSTLELNATFLRSASNTALADRVLITGDHTPDAVAADLVREWKAVGR